ncbi:hypothetical protein [Bacillus sp. 18-5]|uniref:hypothetical protein n=1 Tax=Bacillus sp. 18-5 TaxID=3458701 RepID=UPI004045B878
MNKKVLFSFLDCSFNTKTIFIEDKHGHYSGHYSLGDKSFDVIELPLYKDEMLEYLTQEKEFTSRDYDTYLILASIVNGHLDNYMDCPFPNPIDCNDWSIKDIKEKRIEISILLTGEGLWDLDSGSEIEKVHVDSYDYLKIFVEGETLLEEFSIESESSIVDRDLQVKALLDIVLDLNGELILYNEKL